MEIFNTVADLRAARSRLGPALSLGFTPTMGYLHAGHVSLVNLSQADNDLSGVSIFVNPTQFGPNEDFSRYPRDAARDLALLEQAGVDWVFLPSVEEIYPAGYATYVQVKKITEKLEGAARPGHFDGVATVVAKLFNIVQPSRAYFGQKDAQQVAVIKRMAQDLNLPLQIVVGATLRENDGLAMSSRNVYLNDEERAAATVLSRALFKARDQWAAGEHDADKLRQTLDETLAAEPLAKPDYASIADPETLAELHGPISNGALASMAVRIGRGTRLIDNVALAPGAGNREPGDE